MTIFVLLVLLGAAASLISYRRPTVALMLPLGAWVTIHSGLARQMTSGIELHPAVALVFGIAAVHFLTGRIGVRTEERRGIAPSVLMTLAIPVLFGLLSYITNGIGGGFLWVELILAPFLWLALLIDTASRGHRVAHAVLKVTLAGAVVNSLVAFQQQVTGTVWLIEDTYSFYWWWRGALPRPLGLMDSPVQLGMLLSVATAMLFYVRRTSLALLLALVFFGAALVAASRTSLVIQGAIFVVIVLGSRTRLDVKVLAVIAVGGALGYLLRSAVADLALQRFSEEAGSGDLRRQAFDYFLGEVPELLLVGRGAASASGLRGAELRSSLENGWLIWIYEYGLVAVLLAVAVLGGLVVSGWARGGRRWAGPLLALVGVVQAAAFSSTGSSTACVAFLIVAVFVASFQAALPRLGEAGGRRTRMTAVQPTPRRTESPLHLSAPPQT